MLRDRWRIRHRDVRCASVDTFAAVPARLRRGQTSQIDLVEVIGVPSERYGEEVMAWVRLREGTTATAEDLVTTCRGRIATYKIPRYWKFVDSFPMTVTGKTQKYRMRQIAIQELGLKAAA